MIFLLHNPLRQRFWTVRLRQYLNQYLIASTRLIPPQWNTNAFIPGCSEYPSFDIKTWGPRAVDNPSDQVRRPGTEARASLAINYFQAGIALIQFSTALPGALVYMQSQRFSRMVFCNVDCGVPGFGWGPSGDNA